MKKIIFLSIILSFVLSGCFHEKDQVIEDANDTNIKKVEDLNEDNSVKEDEQEKVDEIVNDQVNQEDATVDLQIYRNEEYGFEFQYPTSWKGIKQMQASSADYLPDSRNFTAIYPYSYPAPDFSARVDVYNESFATIVRDNPFIKNMSAESVTINGILWKKMGDTNYLTEKNGKTYHVSGQSDLSSQIVLKFKFIEIDSSASSEQAETADWQTYRNEEYGFEVKYPSDWNFNNSKYGIGWFSDNLNSFRFNISNLKGIVQEGMDEKEALKLEDGRMAMPLINDKYLTINNNLTYRTERRLEKGDVISEDLIIDETDTEILYTFIKDKEHYYLRLNFKNENNEIVKLFDSVVKTFKFIN